MVVSPHGEMTKDGNHSGSRLHRNNPEEANALRPLLHGGQEQHSLHLYAPERQHMKVLSTKQCLTLEFLEG